MKEDFSWFFFPILFKFLTETIFPTWKSITKCPDEHTDDSVCFSPKVRQLGHVRIYERRDPCKNERKMKYFTHAQKYLNSELFTILTCVPYRHTRVHSAWLTLPFDWLFQSNMCLIIRSRRYLYKSPSFIFFLNHIDSHLSYCFSFNYSKEHTVSYKGTVFFLLLWFASELQN